MLPPRTKMVTALDCLVPSTTSMRSCVVPNTISFTCVRSPQEWCQLPSSRVVSVGMVVNVRRAHIHVQQQLKPNVQICSRPHFLGLVPRCVMRGCLRGQTICNFYRNGRMLEGLGG